MKQGVLPSASASSSLMATRATAPIYHTVIAKQSEGEFPRVANTILRKRAIKIRRFLSLSKETTLGIT
ncbi:hypothetical protein BDQ12DRAFT_723613 [Crucibulum laeve]|uniref:Uncharacterized protein n=1 Tax=Crucibulum laeve TaxID=68775 RepID=A0A5C3LYF2_9AGAR|nr:hypothetical protein BDQ12DRAFT_723613 [Crucibulum laeve]